MGPLCAEVALLIKDWRTGAGGLLASCGARAGGAWRLLGTVGLSPPQPVGREVAQHRPPRVCILVSAEQRPSTCHLPGVGGHLTGCLTNRILTCIYFANVTFKH